MRMLPEPPSQDVHTLTTQQSAVAAQAKFDRETACTNALLERLGLVGYVLTPEIRDAAKQVLNCPVKRDEQRRSFDLIGLIMGKDWKRTWMVSYLDHP